MCNCNTDELSREVMLLKELVACLIEDRKKERERVIDIIKDYNCNISADRIIDRLRREVR